MYIDVGLHIQASHVDAGIDAKLTDTGLRVNGCGCEIISTLGTSGLQRSNSEAVHSYVKGLFNFRIF